MPHRPAVANVPTNQLRLKDPHAMALNNPRWSALDELAHREGAAHSKIREYGRKLRKWEIEEEQ